MATISRSVEVAVPPRKAWETVTDPSRYAEWQTWHGGFPDGAPRRFAPEVSFREVIRTMGQAGMIEWTIQDVEAPGRLVLAGGGPMGISVRTFYRIEATAVGSRVTIEREFKGAAVRAIKWMLEQQVGPVLEASLENLKRLHS